MSERKQKYLSNFIVTLGAFLGFEALNYTIGIFQLKISLYLALYIYVFHIFWLTFLFDLHLKKRGVLANARINHKGAKMLWEALKERLAHISNWNYFRHYQNYLVLPGMIYWGAVSLLFLNPFKGELKQMIIWSATFAMGVAYWFMKEHISRRLEAEFSWIKILSLVKLYAAFLLYSTLIAVSFRYSFSVGFLMLGTMTVSFLLIYQALFQHHLLNFHIFIWNVIIALAMGIIAAWVYTYWNAEYFTGGLVMLAVYNTMWGILHHQLDKTLSRKIVFEYVLMMILIISFLFAGHNFNQRVM
jgi:hypothetical protein